MTTVPAHAYGASLETRTIIADLVFQERPTWDPALVRVILADLAPRMSTTDLTLLALRAAKNRDLAQPRGMLWRGPHWDGLDAEAPTRFPSRGRCSTCGKTEERCAYRPGRDDDHPFEAPR